MAWMFILDMCWHLLHLLISIMHIASDFIQVVSYYIISSEFWRKHHVLELDNLRHLAIVVDNEEVKNTTELKQLLQWLLALGINHVILYDMEGALKNSMDALLENSTSSGITSCFDSDIMALLQQGRITLELLSFTDGKEGTAKAASILCSKYLKGDTGIGNKGTIFTETDMAHALKLVGCGGPEPDLLLIFGPARCHLGFPAWRIRYTEFVHMGSLKSLKYGAVVKVIYDFSKKHQNYGT